MVGEEDDMLSLEPLGDQAVLARFADEERGLRWAAAARRLEAPWLVDVVQAYTTVAVFFDPEQARYATVAAALTGLATAEEVAAAGRRHEIPCCYELALDLPRIAAQTGLSAEEVVRLHASAD